MTERQLHDAAAWGVIATALPVALYLLFRPAPYGRHHSGGWGPTLPARAGWILMEAPASLVFLVAHLTGRHASEGSPLFLLALWQLHYAYRAFLYPLGLEGRPIPVAIALSGALFNVINAGLNGRWVGHLGSYGTESLLAPVPLAGLALFLGGLVVNRQADAALRELRRRSPSGYQVPHGGLHELVSCPNYLGEIVQWAGWALLTRSLSGLAFFVFTTANLLPRALAHHRWYRRTFPDYPEHRRALVPYLL